jgi:hypothetical protein
VAQSHYEVLGISPAADHADIRRAYLERAREAHPDRHIDAGTADRAIAERRMQEVNEAWRVLGNQRRRRRYDLERAPQKMFVSRTDGTMPADSLRAFEDEEIDTTTRLIRGLPWMILVFVLFAIFVFTAYATSGGSIGNPSPSSPGQCVAVTDGPAVTPVACGSPGARIVVGEVDTTQQCPLGSERLQPAVGSRVYCLEVRS